MLSNLYAKLYFAFNEKILPRYVIRRVLTSATIGPLVLHKPKAIALNPSQRDALIMSIANGNISGLNHSFNYFQIPYFVLRCYYFH